MKILVTGAKGFLGANVLRHMCEAHPARQIVAVDYTQVSEAVFLGPAQVEYRDLDVRDRTACGELMRAVRPTHVIHAAAVTLTDESPESKELTTEVNLEGTENIFKAAVATSSVERVLMLSSSGVYAHATDDSPCDEEHPLDLSTSYARTKREAEMLMAGHEAIAGFPIVAARVGPVYGEFEASRASRPKISMIQQLLNCLIEKRTLRIAGTNSHRDWTHARDIARALNGLLVAPALNHRIYNVSAGVSVSARSMLDIFIDHGLKVEWVDDADAADIFLGPQQDRKSLVIERLQQDTGFRPQFDIRSGIDHLLAATRQL